MTLDREERLRREELLFGATTGELKGFVLTAHNRITELEEALHARRLRCEDLESLYLSAERSARRHYERSKGYRQSAIILRDLSKKLREERDDAREWHDEHCATGCDYAPW